MATKEQIKKAILEVAGNPESGVVAALAERMAEAVAELDNPAPAKSGASVEPAKETRITKPTETR